MIELTGISSEMLTVGHIDTSAIRSARIMGTFYCEETDRFVFASRLDDGTVTIDAVRIDGPLFLPIPGPPPISGSVRVIRRWRRARRLRRCGFILDDELR